MSENIFIGVDGGATKSKVRIENAEGELLGQALGGPSNITRFSVEAAWSAIYGAIDAVLTPLNISLENTHYRFHLGLGLAGCEVPASAQAFLAYPHSFAKVSLTTDAHVACIGAHAGKDGAIIIIGTGVVGYQTQEDMQMQVGGWGFPHDDQGGGAWLGLQACSLTFQSLDGRAQSSSFTQAVFAYFENDLDRFVTFANRANSNDFGQLAPLVVQHSKQGDEQAIALMQAAARAIDKVSEALILQQKKPGFLSCALFGGLAPFVKPWLNENLQARIVEREGDANVGAILLARAAAQ